MTKISTNYCRFHIKWDIDILPQKEIINGSTPEENNKGRNVHKPTTRTLYFFE